MPAVWLTNRGTRSSPRRQRTEPCHSVAERRRSFRKNKIGRDNIRGALVRPPTRWKSNCAPARATSPWAVTGLYFYDGRATQLAGQLAPSVRSETEITDLNQAYLQAGELRVIPLGPGVAWWDCGTLPKLHDAAASIRSLEVDTGRKCPSPEEAALRAGCLTTKSWQALLERLPDGPYRRYLELLPTTSANSAAA